MAKNKNKGNAPQKPEADKQAELDAALELDATETEAPADEQLDLIPEVEETEQDETTEDQAPEAEPVKEDAAEKPKLPKSALRKEKEDVLNAQGKVAYRRLAPKPSVEKPKTKERTKYKDRTRLIKPNDKGVSHNASYLAFPSDRWGITKDLKKAIIDVASRCAGDDAKKELIDDVLRIGIGHLNAKFKVDNGYKNEKRKAAEARAEAEAVE
jgi:hypothetical protein